MLTQTKYGYTVNTNYEDNDVIKEEVPKYITDRMAPLLSFYTEDDSDSDDKTDLEKEALAEAQKIIKENPDDYHAYQYLIFVSMITEDFEALEGIYETMFKKFPEKLNVKVSYIHELAEDKEFEKIKEICGNQEPSFDNIAGDKKTLELRKFEAISEVLTIYYLESGNKEKGDDYYEELKKVGGDYSNLRHAYYPEFIDTLNEGDSVKIKDGYIDDETQIDMSGWQGRVYEILLDEELVYIEWDSHTLRAMSMENVESLIEFIEEFDLYVLEPESIELAKPRDSEKDVENAFNEIMEQLKEKNKIKGFPYEMYEEIKALSARNGRVFTEIMSTLQGNRKTFDRINIKKMANDLELSSSDLIKAIDELQNTDKIKTYYSSVLKKDRERWFFLKTEENYDIYEKLIKKEMSPKDLEKINQDK